jgi:hypothetical protein
LLKQHHEPRERRLIGPADGPVVIEDFDDGSSGYSAELFLSALICRRDWSRVELFAGASPSKLLMSKVLAVPTKPFWLRRLLQMERLFSELRKGSTKPFLSRVKMNFEKARSCAY